VNSENRLQKSIPIDITQQIICYSSNSQFVLPLSGQRKLKLYKSGGGGHCVNTSMQGDTKGLQVTLSDLKMFLVVRVLLYTQLLWL
jgi:hypothetical protein